MARPRRALHAALLLLLLAAALCMSLYSETRALAQKVVGGDHVAMAFGDHEPEHHTTATKTTVTITRARVAATIETTRIAGSGVAGQAEQTTAPRQSLEQCSTSEDAQCAPTRAKALPTPDKDDEHDDAYRPQQAMAAQQLVVLDLMARHLEALQDQVNAWLPTLQATATRVIGEIQSAWASLAANWRVFQYQCVAFYDHFLADAVDALWGLYHQLAVVIYDCYSVGRGYVDGVVVHAYELWETHEEVRVATRHAVALLLLALLGALFFSVYALLATVPDTVSAMWTSLDDLTRAQLKIVLVLVAAFTVYHLRALWSFWLLLGAVLTFYYWSGHVLAKTMKPPQRSLSRQASRAGGSAAADKLKTQ